MLTPRLYSYSTPEKAKDYTLTEKYSLTDSQTESDFGSWYHLGKLTTASNVSLI